MKFINELNMIKREGSFLFEAGKKPYNFDHNFTYTYDDKGTGYQELPLNSEVERLLSVLRNASPKFSDMADRIELEGGHNITAIVTNLNSILAKGQATGTLDEKRMGKIKILISLLNRLDKAYDDEDARDPRMLPYGH